MTAIREATLALDKATRRFAELMMDAAVSTALRGKTMTPPANNSAKRHRSPSHGPRRVQMIADDDSTAG